MTGTQAPSTPDLSEQAARVRLAINRMARRLRQEANTDLGPASIAALATIERSGPSTPSELARIEGIQRPTATRLLTRLTDEGYVTRTADPTDGRSSIVDISPAGRAALNRLRKRKTAYLASSGCANFPRTMSRRSPARRRSSSRCSRRAPLSAAVRRSFRSSFASLKVRNYRLYFGGQIVSLAGNWMQIVAELWLILTLTDSGVAVGIATALQFTGILLFGALGGSLADRFDKRKLLMVTQTGMAVPAMLLFVLAVSGSAQAWMVFVVIGLRGLVLAVDNPARQAFVIELVGPDRVLNAVSLNSVLVHSARITGPAIAGVIIALCGVAPCFAVNALSFAAMLFALCRMHPDKLHRPRHDRPRGNVREALRHVVGRRELRVPLALMLVLSTVGFNFQVVLPLLAERSFAGQVSSYSLLMVAMGIGSILGALTVGTKKRVSRELITASALGFGVTSLLAAAAPTLRSRCSPSACSGSVRSPSPPGSTPACSSPPRPRCAAG